MVHGEQGSFITLLCLEFFPILSFLPCLFFYLSDLSSNKIPPPFTRSLAVPLLRTLWTHCSVSGPAQPSWCLHHCLELTGNSLLTVEHRKNCFQLWMLRILQKKRKRSNVFLTPWHLWIRVRQGKRSVLLVTHKNLSFLVAEFVKFEYLL